MLRISIWTQRDDCSWIRRTSLRQTTSNRQPKRSSAPRVRLHRGLLNTRDHDLVILIDGRSEGEPKPLPAGDPWRDRFRPLEPLSAYATTFRYSLSPAPKVDDLRSMLATLITLRDLARTELT